MESPNKRKLAHVEQVVDIEQIPNYDRVEYVSVLGWKVIQSKDTVKVGDKVVYIEIDSQTPPTEPFAFLENKKYRVRSLKMCGVISQGLIMTFDALGLNPDKYEIGDDMTKVLGITKIETQEEKDLIKAEKVNQNAILTSIRSRHKKAFAQKWFKKMLQKEWFKRFIIVIWGRKKDKPRQFPHFIVKTDETRIENMPQILADKEHLYIVTEKIDGTSTTFAVRRKQFGGYEFIVCSRNVRQADIDQETFWSEKGSGNVYWDMAKKYNIKNVLIDIAKKYDQEVVILQGETIGNVQGNPYKLKENEFYGYNLIFTNAVKSFYNKFDPIQARAMVASYNINWVPILDDNFRLPDTIEEMKIMAEGKSKINPAVQREGLVYRSHLLENKDYISFKNVSNSFLLKKGRAEEKAGE